MPHFPEYYPTLQSISHLSNRGRAWVRKNSEMMIVVVVRSLQSSSVGVYYYTHNTILCLRSVLSCISLANQVWNCKQEVYLGFPALLQTVPCVSVPIWDVGMETRLGTHQSPCRVWCVLLSWQLQHCSVVVAVVLDHPAYDSCCVTQGPLTLSNQLVFAPHHFLQISIPADTVSI